MAKSRRGSREGDVLNDKYRLDALLGAGGMGEVYRAENVHIGRAVAIKMLREEHAENADVVSRFLREARAANIVRHPNVVDVLDIGQAADGSPYIVQELLEGQDLAGYVTARGGKLEVYEALELLVPVIDAVGYAHERGVIHRDLKPENVFLARTQTGAIVPKLLDFGISRIVSGEDVRMTATGMSIGTPAYMSPEQIRADRVIDARTDVWSIGVIVHELLSGNLPFNAEAQSGLFVKIVTEPPIPLDVALPGAPPALSAIVERCLKANPAERFANAAEVAREIRGMMARGPTSLARVAVQVSAVPVHSRDAATENVAPRASMASGGAGSGGGLAVGAPPVSSMRAPMAPAVVPDLELPVSRPKASAAPAAPRTSSPGPRAATAAAAAPSGGGGQRMVVEDDFGADIVQTSDLQLDMGMRQPGAMPSAVGAPRVASASRALRNDVQEMGPSIGSTLLGMGVMWAIVLGITGALTTVLSSGAGWPVVTWAATLERMPPWVAAAAAGVLAVLGVAAFVMGARAQPTSWGLVVAGPGLLADAAVVAGFAVQALPRLTGNGGFDALERVLFPWPTVLVFVGVSIVALRRAWWSWATGRPGRASGTALGVVLAAAALFAAVQVARGAEAAPTATFAS